MCLVSGSIQQSTVHSMDWSQFFFYPYGSQVTEWQTTHVFSKGHMVCEFECWMGQPRGTIWLTTRHSSMYLNPSFLRLCENEHRGENYVEGKKVLVLYIKVIYDNVQLLYSTYDLSHKACYRKTTL